MSKTPAGFMHFLQAGLMKQVQTGAIVPSQRFLINKMIDPIPEAYRGQIVELGAGNGAITLRLAARCPEARILACEINPTLAQDNRYNLAKAGTNGRVEVVTDSAEHVLAELDRRGTGRADYIISSIPLGNMSRKRGLALINVISKTLARGGMYVQFQYSLLHRRKIQAKFPNVRTVPVLLNFPPAVVYYAQR